jgi:hypothetical protein
MCPSCKYHHNIQVSSINVSKSILDSTAFSSVRDKRAYSEEDDEDKCLLLGINVSRVLIGYPE